PCQSRLDKFLRNPYQLASREAANPKRLDLMLPSVSTYGSQASGMPSHGARDRGAIPRAGKRAKPLEPGLSTGTAARLLLLNACGPGRVAPVVRLRGDDMGEGCRRAADRHVVGPAELRLHLRHRQHTIKGGVELVDDRWRRPVRHHRTHPRAEIHLLHVNA